MAAHIIDCLTPAAILQLDSRRSLQGLILSQDKNFWRTVWHRDFSRRILPDLRTAYLNIAREYLQQENVYLWALQNYYSQPLLQMPMTEFSYLYRCLLIDALKHDAAIRKLYQHLLFLKIIRPDFFTNSELLKYQAQLLEDVTRQTEGRVEVRLSQIFPEVLGKMDRRDILSFLSFIRHFDMQASSSETSLKIVLQHSKKTM